MKRFVREYVLKNWSLKATALLLALILWLFVRGEPGPERVLSVPVEVQIPRQMEIVNERPATVEVTMRGAPFSNMWFGQVTPSCILDLKNAEEGEHVVPLTIDNIRLSKGSGIEVLQVSPARITIVLERTVTKEVPVTVPIRETPPQGYEVYSRKVMPASVSISGPRSRIDPIREVSTDAVSLAGHKQSTSFLLELQIKDSAIRISPGDPVQVEFQLGERRSLFTIANVPVVCDDADFAATPGHIAVQLLSPPRLMEKITAADFSAVVRTKALAASTLPARMKPMTQLLDDMNGALVIRGTEPVEVTVRRK